MTDLQLDSGVRVEASPVGPVVHPPRPAGTVVLYLHGDRYLSGAPESALVDVHAGYRYSQAAGPVVVAGERLGAGLAAALLARLRDAGDPLPRCAVLVSALLDLTMQAPSLLLNAAADPAFRVTELRRRVLRYAAGRELTDPRLSPLHANLHGLPPVQLLVAGNDLLLDDSLAFAARAARSGVTVDLRVRPDAASLRAEVGTAMAAFFGEVDAMRVRP